MSMAGTTTPASRIRVTENGDELRVLVPVRRDWVLLIFLSLGIAALIVNLVYEWHGKRHFAMLFFQFMMYGIWALCLWFWNVAGVEEISANTDAFSIRHSAFRMGRTHEFEPCKMCNLRVAPSHIPLTAWENCLAFVLRRKTGYRQWSGDVWGGPLAFDYGDKNYRFGGGLTETEACELLPPLLRRLSPDDPPATSSFLHGGG